MHRFCFSDLYTSFRRRKKRENHNLSVDPGKEMAGCVAITLFIWGFICYVVGIASPWAYLSIKVIMLQY